MTKYLRLAAAVAAVVLVAGCAEAGAGQRVKIAVTEKGFEPKVVTVKAHKPVTLLVTRRTEKTCATELVLKEHGIDQKLPFGKTVAITFTPERTGELTYACAMDMIHGKIVVQ